MAAPKKAGTKAVPAPKTPGAKKGTKMPAKKKC